MKAWLFAYGGALLALAVLDGAWLTAMKSFYQQEMAAVIAPDFRVAPAVAFYLGYPIGLITLALGAPRADGMIDVAWRAALVGAVAYGTYDLTNMATLRSWSLKLVLVDMAWGIFISAAAGAAAWWAAGRA